jgi:uncharacterized membrane protein
MDKNPYQSPVPSVKEPMNRQQLRDLIVAIGITIGGFMAVSGASIIFLPFTSDLPPREPSPFARSAVVAYAIIGCAIVWKSIAWLRRPLPQK